MSIFHHSLFFNSLIISYSYCLSRGFYSLRIVATQVDSFLTLCSALWWLCFCH